MALDGIKGSMEIDGLDELEQTMLEAVRRNKKEYKRLLMEVGERIMHHAAKRVSVKSGRLKASFERKPYNGKVEGHIVRVNKDTVEAGSSVFYAGLAENGHVLKKGRKKATAKVIGYVKGQHFYANALEDTRREIPHLVAEFFERLFGPPKGGGGA